MPVATDINLKVFDRVAGLYIHIPYCKRKCSYCNFHFSTNLSNRKALLSALIQEIKTRALEASTYLIKTIYFGGGTPSLLDEHEFSELFSAIKSNYSIDSNAEITLEANPDDINFDYLTCLRNIGINRLSIGVQSFIENDLIWMNRAHNVGQSHESIQLAIRSGFQNFSIDLMYGLPNSIEQSWSENLSAVSQYDIPHISCYALTVEERTTLDHRIKTNEIRLPDDLDTIQQMDMLLDFCEAQHYEAYEISNFAKSGFRSRHNSSYWEGIPYFGFGPAAHSFNNNVRRWNIANNALYIKCIQSNLPCFESEVLSKKNQCNEYLMLQLRRIEGIDPDFIASDFPEFYDNITSSIDVQIQKDTIQLVNGRYILTRKGKYIADEVSACIFV